jgi:sarcosine oxidase subunit gamma
VAEPARSSALEGVRPADRGGLLLAERRGLTLVHLAGRPARQSFLEAAQGALGVALPLEPNTTARSQDLTVFWLAPGRWLIESEVVAAADLEERFREAPDAAGAAIADVSGGRTVIRISGAAARHTLAKGCPIDLHPRAFLPGSVAHSMLEGISVMLHYLPDGDAFDLYVARSYARAAWEWLTGPPGKGGRSAAAPRASSAKRIIPTSKGSSSGRTTI